MRTLLLSKSDERYLQKCSKDLHFAYGIIIGQIVDSEKLIVVHLAKNGEEDVETASNAEESMSQGPQNIADIDTQELTSQWISASKMIPGSFNVIGIFVTSQQDTVLDDKEMVAAKKMMYEVHSLLQQSHTYPSSAEYLANVDYILLSYSAASKKAICKSYSNSTNGGNLTPMDCRFAEKGFEWYTVETNYEFDDIFPILDESTKINIEQEFQKSIELVKNGLAVSEIFLQNESVENDLLLDAYVKRKFNSRKKDEIIDQTLKASIFLPVKCQIKGDNAVKITQCNGTIRFTGVISSRIWCNPKTSLGDVKLYLRVDILRSLIARIQVYCDGLTEPNVTTDAIFISEPPRRVYFNLPSEKKNNPIQFSEYIFRGEAPTVAVAQAKQILDIDLRPENIITDLERVTDDAVFGELSSDVTQQPVRPLKVTNSNLNRTMYMLGITVSLLVLVLSVLLHHFTQ